MAATKLSVLHVGPSATGVGGMSSVIRTICETASYDCEAVNTWHGDVVHDALRILRIAARIAAGAVRSRKPVVHAHLSEGGSWVREGGLVVLAHLLGYRTAITMHGAQFHDFIERPRMRSLVTFVLRRCDVLFALAEQDADAVGRLSPRTVIRLIYNPVTVPVASAAPTEPENEALFLGIRSTRKGLDLLLAAWPEVARQTGCSLVVAGPPGDVAVETGGYVRDVGLLAPDQARAALRASALCVLPSRREVLPMSLLESLAESTPIVATAVAGIPRLVGSGACRLVEEPVSAETVARAVIAALDPGWQAMARAGARRWVDVNCSPAAVHRTLLAGYAEVR